MLTGEIMYKISIKWDRYLFSAAILTLFFVQIAGAGTVKGKVTDDANNSLAGVNIVIEGTAIGASTDLKGDFVIAQVPAGEVTVMASHIGYMERSNIIYVSAEKDAIVNFQLDYDPVSLEMIEVEAMRKTSHIKMDEPVRIEVVSGEELRRSSTDGGLLSALGKQTGLNTRPCALCGSAGIGMQGLDPSYTEINIDGLPVLSGLGSLYGLDAVAVNDISKVDIIKGSGSSEYGAGAIAGAVNLATAEPADISSLKVKLSGGETMQHSFDGNMQRNINGIPLRFSVNYGAEPLRINRNSDDFTDTPQYYRLGLNLSAAKTYSRGVFRAGVRLYGEDRFAGDVDWKTDDRGSADVYGRDIHTRRGEVSLKYSSNHLSWGSWSYESAYVQHNHDSWYGITEFDAQQTKAINRLSFVRECEFGHSTLLQGMYSYNRYEAV